MRHRGAVFVLSSLLIGCASVTLPESGTTVSADAPPARRARTDGRSDGPSPVWLRVQIRTPEWERTIAAWCREGVWTPLDARKPERFVVAESWSRLGDRAPRRLSRREDAVWSGVMARLRARSDGLVDFVVEVAAGDVASVGPSVQWEGAEIRFPRPRQTLYRFEGRTGKGELARWGDLRVSLLDGTAATTSSAVRFNHGFVEGGTNARAEYEVTEWRAVETTERDLEGVLQATFRLQQDRRAAGFRYDVGWKTFGTGVRIDG